MATFSSGDAIQNPYLAAAAKSEGINYVFVNGHVVIDRANHGGMALRGPGSRGVGSTTQP